MMSDIKRLEPNTAYQTRHGMTVLTDSEGWIIEHEPRGETFSFDAELTRLRKERDELREALTKIAEETRGWGGTLGGVHKCAAKALANTSREPK